MLMYHKDLLLLCTLVHMHSVMSSTLSPRTFCSADLRADGTNQWTSSYALGTSFPTLTWGIKSINNDQDQQRSVLPVSFTVTMTDISTGTSFTTDAIISSQTRHVFNHSTFPLLSGHSYQWRVHGVLSFAKTEMAVYHTDTTAAQADAQFHISLLKDAAWNDVAWIGSNTTNVYRTTFNVSKLNGNSTPFLYVAGLGYSFVEVNGKKIDVQHLVTAPWTANERLVGFSALDISSYLIPQTTNAITITLGNGWRSVNDFPSDDKELGGDTTQRVLRAQLVLSPGSPPVTFTGDGTWKTIQGPSTFDSVYDGETYDASFELKFQHQSAWFPATVLSKNEGPRGKMIPWSSPPVSINRIIPPVSMTQPVKNVYVYDFGVNVAGVVRLNRIPQDCVEGDSILLHHGEIMQHSGLPDLGNHADPRFIYTGNLRSAKATDQYICSGKESANTSWYPRLTYHGFRFLQINVTQMSSSNTTWTKDDVDLLHIHSAVSLRTNVTFPQSPTLNTLQQLALGAQRSNFMTVPTDCDQRDERLGWMGDANLSGDSMALNYKVLSFFNFYLKGIAAEVGQDGSLTDTVPFVRYGSRPGDVSWTAAFINLNHVLWKIMGDDTSLLTHFDAMVMQMRNVQSQATSGLDKMHTPYGDWCPPPVKMGTGQGPKPSSPYTSAFSYLNMVRQMLSIAQHVRNATVIDECQKLNATVTDAFNTVFGNGGPHVGCYDDCSTQTGLVLALALQLAGANTPATQALLVHDVEELHHSHYSTGIIGAKFLYDVLKDAGKEELSLTLLENVDYPSIGYYFANKQEQATENLWELPDALVEGTGMNSRNHHMWSSYSAYLVRSIGGLNVDDESGVGQYLFSPGSVSRIFSSSVVMHEPNGIISLTWTNHGGLQSRKVAVASNVSLEMDCGKFGGLIERIQFHSFGTPTERNSLFVKDDQCHGAPLTINTSMCIGQQKCTVPTKAEYYETLPMSCLTDISRPLTVWMEVQCSLSLTLEVNVNVPIGSFATIKIPTYRLLSSELENATVVITENEKEIYVDAKNGIRSIKKATDHAQRHIVNVNVANGRYNFVVKTILV